MLYPKTRLLRSEAYRRYVASKPCFGCGIDGWSQAAHANFGKGLGMKVCDSKIFPLCVPRFGLIGCHQQHDNCLDMSRDQRRELEAEYVERMQEMAEREGWDMETLKRKP